MISVLAMTSVGEQFLLLDIFRCMGYDIDKNVSLLLGYIFETYSYNQNW
jgi:hypothetical protein